MKSLKMYGEKHNEHKERNQDNVKKVVKNAVIYLGVIKIRIYVHIFCSGGTWILASCEAIFADIFLWDARDSVDSVFVGIFITSF